MTARPEHGNRPTAPLRALYLTAGAGGMFCGSCLNDNAVAKVLPQFGWDAQLVPCYTPIRIDGTDVSIDRVFFGGVNVWLQQKVPFFRWLPRFADRFLDNPGFVRRVTSTAVETDARFLGSLALSMLRGMQGNQRKEVRRLVDWIVQSARPDVVIVSNILIAAFVSELRRHWDVPVVVMLQGDDVFLRYLPEGAQRACLAEIRQIARGIDLFVTHSADYREYISGFLGIEQQRMEIVPLGIDPSDFHQVPEGTVPGGPQTIGFLARLAPEKGLHRLVDAFLRLCSRPDWTDLRLRVGGWLGADNRDYAGQQWQKLREAGLEDRFEYRGVLDRQQKVDFFRGLSLFSVPAVQREPKGLFVLESLAAGVPVVLPDHGAFPELLADTGGGRLFPNESEEAYVDCLACLLSDPEAACELGAAGRRGLIQNRTTLQSADSLDRILRRLISEKTPAAT